MMKGFWCQEIQKIILIVLYRKIDEKNKESLG